MADLNATVGKVAPLANAVATMNLDDEMPWWPLFAGKDDAYDDIGFAFTAETDEFDLMLGNFIYMFQGGKAHPRSQWLGDGLVHNGLVVIVPKERRGKGMWNNNFSRSCMNLAEFHDYDQLRITRTEDKVVWQLGDIVYTCAPPYWHLGGREGEVEYDIHFHQMDDVPVAWSWGDREHAAREGIGAGYCLFRCEGTIVVGGKRYDLKNGCGVHERLAWSEKFDPIANVALDRNGYGSGFAIHSLDGDVRIWALGNMDTPRFELTVEGREMIFEPSAGDGSTVKYVPLDPWHDPRSGTYMPSRWHVECESAEGRLEIDIDANGRAYYPWDLKRGMQLMFWYLCTINGKFTYPDGREVPLVNQLAQHEIVKNVIVHQETMAGPVLTPMW